MQSKIVDIPILIIFSIIYFKRDTSKSVLSFSKLVVNFKADLWHPQLPGLLEHFDTCVSTKVFHARVT